MKLFSRILPLMLVLAFFVVPGVLAQDEMMMFSADDCDYGGNFSSIEAVDDMTVKFTLCTPDPAFPAKVAFSAFGIHPSEYLEATGGTGDLIQNPIGTGPYMVERWDLGNELVLSKYDGYWDAPAIEDTVIFRWNSEAAARFTELQAGTVDGIDNPGEADFAVIEADPNYNLYPRSGTNVFYLGINNTVEPFNDVRVRQAISYGLDKQRLVDNFYPPGSAAATQFMPPAIFGYTEGFEALPFDQDMARSLLEEAAADMGFELPIQTTISYRDVVRSYLPTPGIVAADIQAQLAAIGIDVEITVMESGAFLDASDAGELSLHMLGWGADYPDATNFLDFHFGGGSSDQFGDKYEDIIALLNEAASLSDADARLAIYADANAAIRDEVPMVPVAHGGSGVAYAADIAGAYASDIGAAQFALMEDPDDDNIIWMQNAEPISLYCADETDGETLRACEQVNQSLLAYAPGSGAVVPSLAAEYSANDDLTEWTFVLRDGVTFHDGTTLDAADVIMSYVAQWDASSPLHTGRDGNFTYFSALFGGFVNAPEGE